MSDAQQAMKQAIETEKNAMKFYELGAKQMKDKDARRMFEQLAKEEKEHALHFYRAYTGGDIGGFEDYMSAPPDHESAWISAMVKTIESDFTEKKALEVAMEKESNLEQALLATAAQIKDPQLRQIFSRNATETHNHYLTIESEYARIMAMVDESDIDTFVRE
jgi:rubrerythrin